MEPEDIKDRAGSSAEALAWETVQKARNLKTKEAAAMRATKQEKAKVGPSILPLPCLSTAGAQHGPFASCAV